MCAGYQYLLRLLIHMMNKQEDQGLVHTTRNRLRFVVSLGYMMRVLVNSNRRHNTNFNANARANVDVEAKFERTCVFPWQTDQLKLN